MVVGLVVALVALIGGALGLWDLGPIRETTHFAP